MPRFEVELAASPGITLEVSQREPVAQTVIDLISVFVCALPDGPFEFGSGSWLTSENRHILMPSYRLQKGNANRLSG